MSCEIAKWISFSEPKARKDHRCCECRKVIPKGAIYSRISGIWDGGFDTFATCFECRRLFEWYIKTTDLRHEEMPAFGQLFADIRESGMTIEEAKAEMIKSRKAASHE